MEDLVYSFILHTASLGEWVGSISISILFSGDLILKYLL